MWEFQGIIDYICNHCGFQQSADVQDFDVVAESTYEGNMGIGAIHSIAYECYCQKCDHEITIQFDISIYPSSSMIIESITDMSENARTLSEPFLDYFHLEDELDWLIETSVQAEILKSQLESAKSILNSEISERDQFSFYVMLYGHIVAAIEGYLAGKFIFHVANSDEMMRKFIETDPEFRKRKFTLSKIFKEYDNLKRTVAEYLQNLIFHRLEKIKPMYRDVLNYDFDRDFGDISWLFQAVMMRHHCVHRAGYDQNSKKINLTEVDIKNLIRHAEDLKVSLETHLPNAETTTNQYYSEIYRSGSPTPEDEIPF